MLMSITLTIAKLPLNILVSEPGQAQRPGDFPVLLRDWPFRLEESAKRIEGDEEILSLCHADVAVLCSQRYARST